MKVGTRLAVGFLAVVLATTVGLFLILHSYRQTTVKFTALKRDTIPAAIRMIEMHRTVYKLAHDIMDYVSDRDAGSEQRIVSGLEWLEQAGLRHLEEETHPDPEERAAASEIQGLVYRLLSVTRKIMESKENGADPDELAQMDRETFHPVLQDLDEKLEEHEMLHLQELSQGLVSVHKAHIRNTQIAWVTIAVSTLLAIVAAWFSTRSIVAPLHVLHRWTESVGKGNLDAEVVTSARDEIGQLSKAFKRMTMKLSETLVSKEQLESSLSATNTILEEMPIGVMIIGKDKKIRRVNTRALKMLGMESDEEVVGSICHRYTCPAEVDRCPVLDLGQKVTNSERILLGKGGEKIPVLKTVVSINLEGEDVLLEGFVDVSDRKRAEEELKKSEEMYRTVFDGTAEGILIADIETKKLKYSNSAMCRMLGYTREELEGMAVHDIHPKDALEHVVSEFEAQARGEKTLAIDIPCLRKDGTILYANINTARATIDGRDCNVGFFTDITNRKRAAEELRRNEERLSRFMNSATDIFVLLDADLNILVMNERGLKMANRKREDVIGKNIMDISPEIKKTGRYDRYLEVVKTGKAFFADDVVTQPEFGKMHMVLNAFKVGDGLGIVATDITARKKAEQIKDEFISTVSHELRTPLTSIRGSLGLIAGGVTGKVPAGSKELLDIAVRNCDRLMLLVNDILDVQKIESGKMKFELKSTEIVPLIKQAVSFNQAYAQKYNVEYVLGKMISSGRVNVDSDRLMQVMANLLSNAAKFSPGNEKVVISVSRSGRFIRTSIRDSGPGIPKKFRSQIFVKFAQADSSDARKKGGTGLGLSLSKAIIERMEGKIGFRSTPAGGTTFFFDLPASMEV